MAKFSFLIGFGAGYVLGAKAGRERYEQIRGLWSDAKDNPQLQGLAGMAQARADDVVSSMKSKMGRDTGSDTPRTNAVGTPTPGPNAAGVNDAGMATRNAGTTTQPLGTTTEAPDLTALPVDPPPMV